MKIIGNTVGMGLPKPNMMQNDPSKGDYVKGKEEFAEQFSGGSATSVCHVSYNLVNAVSDNYVSTVNKGDDFEVSLTALDGYAFTSVKIIHNGEIEVDEAYNMPITGYDWGIYSENNGVQGDIVVIAVAELVDSAGEDGKDGEDGFSPIAKVTQTSTGATISITDKDGTTTATITNGKDGADGQDGYTPQKNVDYFDGKDGKDGSNGKDGTSATHSWNGTTLTVTSASGTSSANLKGDKGDKGDSIKGDTGSPGADGVSPTVVVSKSGKVTTISITDKNGTKTATVNDGADGASGSNGKDGTSVTVKSVSESTADGGSNVVTFSDGKTLTVKNGSKGNPGTNGTSVTVSNVSESSASGGTNTVTFSDGKKLNVKNGKDGTPGKTPVAGTDYFTEADKAAMVEEVQNSMDGIPDYWLTHLAAKIPSINTAMETAGRNKSAFYFYTDAHRISSANMAPAILRYLYRHTSIDKTNSGGDFFEPFATGADNLATMRNYMADMRGVPNHHSVLGNHDEDNEALTSDAQLYGFYLAWEESNDIVWGGYHYYYIDNKSENTRYLYLDIGKNLGKSVPMVSNKQMQFVIDSLASLPEGWHVVPIAHIWYDYEISALPDYVLNLLSVFDAYNGRTAGSVTHNGNAFAYDFAEALGNVEFCIGGHVHADQTYYSNGGIPIVIVDADSTAKKGSAATLGTITEGCVTAVVADYSARKLKMIRIGRGSDRTVTLPVYTPAGPEEIVNILDTADIQYNTRWSSSGTKTANGIIIFTIPWADVWNKTIYFKGFTNLTASVGSVSQWSGVSADGATSYGFTDTTNGNIFTSPKIQENNGVYSIKVDAASISASASTFETLRIQLILNSSNTAVSAADLANCIMTIDQPIE